MDNVRLLERIFNIYFMDLAENGKITVKDYRHSILYPLINLFPSPNDELDICQPRVIKRFHNSLEVITTQSAQIALKSILKNDICSLF